MDITKIKIIIEQITFLIYIFWLWIKPHQILFNYEKYWINILICKKNTHKIVMTTIEQQGSIRRISTIIVWESNLN